MNQLPEEYNTLSFKIIGCAMNVHTNLGPGLIEKVYEDALYAELRSKSMMVEKQIRIPVKSKLQGRLKHLTIDLLVEKKIILELKSVDYINRFHKSQILTYLRFTDHKLGLLLNFNVPSMRYGITRVINM